MQRITLPKADTYRFDSPVYLDAAKLYNYPIKLKNPPTRGDDVWALQRYLKIKGFSLPDGPSGIFDAETESLVKSFRRTLDIRGPQLDGTVTYSVWASIVEPYPEPAH